jgi:hypothetical protein
MRPLSEAVLRSGGSERPQRAIVPRAWAADATLRASSAAAMPALRVVSVSESIMRASAIPSATRLRKRG